MDNEIADIINDAEWWIDTLKENKDIDTLIEFTKFCYVYLPTLLSEIKRLQNEATK